MPEIVRNVTITATTKATAQRSKFIGKKHVLIKPWRKNKGKIYIALSYEYSGGKPTDFETIYPDQNRLYGAPRDKRIYYLWFYSEHANSGFQYIASDGSIFGQAYGRDIRFRRYIREPISVTLVNNTKKTIKKTVPVYKKWLVFGALIHNPDDVARGCQIRCLRTDNESFGNMLAWNTTINAGDKIRVPNPSQNSQYEFAPASYPIILSEGEVIEFTWEAGGASSGGSSNLTVLEYIEVDVA